VPTAFLLWLTIDAMVNPVGVCDSEASLSWNRLHTVETQRVWMPPGVACRFEREASVEHDRGSSPWFRAGFGWPAFAVKLFFVLWSAWEIFYWIRYRGHGRRKPLDFPDPTRFAVGFFDDDD